MSGLEVAGAVLGAFPIALIALEECKKFTRRLDRFNNIHLEYKKCRDTLSYHHLIFTRHLRQVLLPLLVDDAMINELLSAPGGNGWKEPRIATLLKQRLQESYGLYLDHVLEMKRVLDEINQVLAANSEIIQRYMQDQEASKVSMLLKAAFNKENMTFQRYRFRFSGTRIELDRLFSNLQDHNNKLEELLDSTDKDTYLVQQNMKRAKIVGIDAALCDFWVQAKRLFTALTSKWNCQCPQHTAQLLLQHRASQKVEFQVTFTNSAMSRWEIQRTRISNTGDAVATSIKQNLTVLGEPDACQPSHRQNRPLKSSLRTKSSTTTGNNALPLPTITIQGVKASPHLHLTRPIENLCVSLRQAKETYCGYLVAEDFRYYVYSISRRTVDTFSCVTLDQILRGKVLPAPTRAQRYNLSLIVASSFLQLLDSNWIPSSFKTTDILFITNAENPIIFLDQPHINCYLGLGNAAKESGNQGHKWNDALDLLGIILLELCFGMPLEEQPCRKDFPTGGSEEENAVYNVMAARKWQHCVNEEAGFEYATAVNWCLGGNRITPQNQWRRNMLRAVIQPLKRSCDYLASGLESTSED